ncbi:TatD family hydrolase [Suttonella sp. R2A3]|uniref:TatD family hydrolase n=1 Tax=Suttonella sp. R2A3 TaxID=2908648 RepID=UPI001F33DF3A|nr:TatD family hydrolase [Suttonella sp. R2A3]UJF24384.1 TatD family hydrolase [Suttonella sp. R2A3]
MTLIDSHCHLDFAIFDEDRDVVFARANAAGVTQMVVPAVAQHNWSAVARMQEDYGVWPAYGLHPVFTDQHQRSDIDALAAWLESHSAVAIGEVGLDGRFDNLSQQEDYFRAQITLAQGLALSLIIHAHAALEQVIQILAGYQGVRFVIHAFSGSDQQLARIFDLGGMIGVGGTLTYSRARRLRRQISQAPLDRLLLETDAPDQPLCGKQGERNEPANVVSVCATLAELRGVDPQTIAQATTDNAQHFFNS